MAEFSGGNFLGEDALYNEVVPSKDKFHHFPFPSLRTSTKYSQLRQSPAPFIKATTTKKGRSINRPFVEKDRDGIPVINHSALTYLATKYPQIPKPKDITIADPKVLQEYHDILIPKAVEYSAGILDYFFRGKLGATICPNGNAYTLSIKNLSGQDLKGGAFELFWDSSDDSTRSPVTSFGLEWFESSSLPDLATVTATFTPPVGVTVAKYTLVYKGTIGTKDGNDPQDLVDAGIAIAAATFDTSLSWWTMDAIEETTGDRIDSARGVHLRPFGIRSGIVNAPNSKDGLGRCIELVSPPSHETYVGHSICGQKLQAGGYVTMAGWFKAQFTPGDGGFTLGVNAGGDSPQWRLSTDDFGNTMLSAQDGNTASISVPSGWVFFILEMDSAGTLAVELNRSASASISFAAPIDANIMPVGGSYSFFTTTSILSLDEIALFGQQLTTAQKNYLWNSGAGRTWPITLP